MSRRPRGLCLPNHSRVTGLRFPVPHGTIAAEAFPEPALTHVHELAGPFQPGTMVLITLGAPREKFWGAILAVSTAGVSLRGMELASFEDCVAMVKAGEPLSTGVVFFPMHRVERMELDLPAGSIPSLSDRFTAQTGLDPRTALWQDAAAEPAGRVHPA